MSKSPQAAINRRQALLRLGLGSAALYLAPALTSLSTAHGASGSGGGSGSASKPSPASPASRPSPASRASAASAPSGPSSPKKDDDGRPQPRSGQPHQRSIRRACRGSESASNKTISRRDSRRARRAVQRGRALPLSDIVKRVQAKYDSKFLSARFVAKPGQLTYQLKMISPEGAVVIVEAAANTAEILHVGGC